MPQSPASESWQKHSGVASAVSSNCGRDGARAAIRSSRQLAYVPHPIFVGRSCISRRERPRDRRAAEKRNELTPLQLTELHTLSLARMSQTYRIGEDQVRGSLRCGISIRSMSAWGIHVVSATSTLGPVACRPATDPHNFSGRRLDEVIDPTFLVFDQLVAPTCCRQLGSPCSRSRDACNTFNSDKQELIGRFPGLRHRKWGHDDKPSREPSPICAASVLSEKYRNPPISAVQISLKALNESLQFLWRLDARGDHIPKLIALAGEDILAQFIVLQFISCRLG